MNQLDLHKKIDEFINAGTSSASVKAVQELISPNDDAKRWFFAKVDEKWLQWLFDNGFFESLKKPKKIAERLFYDLPELDYLIRMVGKNTELVVGIIMSTPISQETFNPEVIGRFFWIVGLLPAEQIKSLLPKILEEDWVRLMAQFNRRSGYEYKKIVDELEGAEDYSSLTDLAKIILTVRKKEELEKTERYFISDKIFYLEDITETGIFEAILKTPDPELVLKVFLDTFNKIVNLVDKKDEEVFDKSEPFYLMGIDVFKLDLDPNRRSHSREDIENFIAVTRKLIEKVFDLVGGNESEIRRIYSTYIANLPDSRTLWKLKLFAMTRYPNILKEEIQQALFRVFNAGERYFELEEGAEYYNTLIIGFSLLSEEVKQNYIKEVVKYFGADLGDKDKEEWRKRDGLKIITYIKSDVSAPDKIIIESIFGKIPEGDAPEPKPDSSGIIRSGFVNHKSPANVGDYSIKQIVEHLKTDWSPKVLNEKFKGDDFPNQRGVEGLGDSLKEDIKKRIDDYLVDINAFFDRNNIHPHYVYSLLRGIEEMLRNKQLFNPTQIGQILGLFEFIKISGNNTPFKRKEDKNWLIDWIEVHKVIADILLYVLENKNEEERALIHKSHRELIIKLISYLLTIKDSPSKQDEKPEYGEPYHIAINSVRGRAYEVFVVFAGNDGKVLAKDSQEIFKETLEDNSLAVRFVIGRYLATFYFRDKELITSLLPEIFPKNDLTKRDIYFATWEGYLSNTLYDELFAKLQEYYSYAITVDPLSYTKRKYSKGLDESLVIHIALAFAHFGLKMTDPLFVQLWNTPNIARHEEFISFLGRTFFTKDQVSEEWLKAHGREKLIAFWDWILLNDKITDPKVLSAFGFWINPSKEVFDDTIIIKNIAETFKKSNGSIGWDYGLLKRLPVFAEKNGEKVLEIISSYLLSPEQELNPNRRSPLLYDHEIKEALDIIYKNGDKALKLEVKDFIGLLIEKGSSMFWDLKEIVKED